MDAPTCKLCGAAHWANTPHKFKSDAHSDAALSWAPQVAVNPPVATVARDLNDDRLAKLEERVRVLESTVLALTTNTGSNAAPESNKVPSNEANKPGKSNGAFDKKAYQREYMARRRARA